MKTSCVTSEDRRDQEIKLSQEQLDQQGNTGSREQKSGPKDSWRTKTVSYLTGTLMDKEQRISQNVNSKNPQGKEGSYLGDSSKLADKTQWKVDGHDRSKQLWGAPRVMKASELTKPQGWLEKKGRRVTW